MTYPGTDGAGEATSLSFCGEVTNLVPPYANLMHVYTQHESALCIQTRIIKLIYLLVYDPQYSRCHRHHTPISDPMLSSNLASFCKEAYVLELTLASLFRLLPYCLSLGVEAGNILYASHRPPD